MKTPSIILDHVSKSYDLDRAPTVKSRVGWFHRTRDDRFSALTDISFSVKKGETVGLFGPNGSGKTTLLKVIAGITKPDSGVVRTDGSIASVLELGTGFHPELTGRDNYYLYGTLLGIAHPTLDAHYNAIVSFSELSSFMGVPVKKYSTGMRARLALSIALHAPTDILLIDEALMVGDGDFRQRFERTFRNIQKNRAVVFASHDLGLLQHLSTMIYFLDRGKITNKETEIGLFYIQSLPMGNTVSSEATSDSMYPLIRKGDKVAITKVPFQRVRAGDVIAFALPNMPQIIIHRVALVESKGSKRSCIMRGDASMNFDTWRVTEKNFLGIIKLPRLH